MADRLKVLTLSEWYPRPLDQVQAVFIEQQTVALQPYCDPVVVVLNRVIPPLRLFQPPAWPHRAAGRQAWQTWWRGVQATPAVMTRKGLPVYYPRFTSLPRQMLLGTQGYVAYPFVAGLLRRLHQEHSFDLIHAHYAAPAGIVALAAQRWMHIPIVLSVHGADVSAKTRRDGLTAALVKRTFRRMGAILTNSSYTARRVVAWGGDPATTRVVYYGGNLTATTDTSIVEYNGPLRLLTVSRLVHHKGIQVVLHALRQLFDAGQHYRYTIVGDGPERHVLERLVDQLQLRPYVQFVGYTPNDALLPYYNQADLFVLPTWDEAFGIVYVEALGQGLPVIGTVDEGGPMDLHALLPDGVELARREDVAGVARAITAFADDPARRARVRQSGPALVQRRFTWDRMARETVAVYQEVTGDR